MPTRTPNPFRRNWPLAFTLALALLPLALVVRTHEDLSNTDSSSVDGNQPVSSDLRAPLPPGLCSLTNLTLGSGSVVDDAGSLFQAYLEGLSTGTGQAQVAALGAIELLPKTRSLPTVVVGEARSAWKGNTTIGHGAFVTGSIEPMALRTNWPSLPSRDLSRATSAGYSEGEHTLTGPLIEWQNLKVSGDAKLTLAGPLEMWVQELEQVGESTIVIDPSGGAVVLHILSGWTQGPNARWLTPPACIDRLAVLVGTGKPVVDEKALAPKSDAEIRKDALRARLRGQISDSMQIRIPLELLGSGQFHGLVYAPFSEVTLPKEFAFRGALTAQAVELMAESRFTTDAAALLAWPIASAHE